MVFMSQQTPKAKMAARPCFERGFLHLSTKCSPKIEVRSLIANQSATAGSYLLKDDTPLEARRRHIYPRYNKVLPLSNDRVYLLALAIAGHELTMI